MKAFAFLFGVLWVALAFKASAYPGFLSEWKKIYPESESGERGCQLCHAFASGGDPWNAYGIEIRVLFQEVYDFDNIILAIKDVEGGNSDNDPDDLSNLQEIELNLDPGWAPGPVNIHVYKNGDVVRNQMPPFVEGSDEGLCVPILAKTGSVTLICL